MGSLKDIHAIELPIPQFDKDLNLVRFKAIFKILEESQNDTVYNTELIKTLTIALDERATSLEGTRTTHTSEISSLKNKTPQAYKTTDAVTFSNVTISGIDLYAKQNEQDASLTTLLHRVPQELRTNSNVELAQLTVATIVLAGADLQTNLDSLDSRATALENEKLDASTYDAFIDNFKLDGGL